MTLRTRIILMITILLTVTVLATATVLTLAARQSLLNQTKADGVLIAQLLARSAGFAEQVPNDVEDAIGEQMIVEATIAAHLVSIAEEAGLTEDEINEHLQDITANSVLDEFWITDETGHAYLRNIVEIDFTFDPDPEIQPQAHIFWALLTGEENAVVQEARVREVDTQVFKYAGVSGVDQPRIVQVGYKASFLENLRQQVGLNRLVNELVGGGNVNAIWVVDEQMDILAYSAASDPQSVQNLDETDRTYIQQAVSEGRTISYEDGAALKVIAPVTNSQGEVLGVTLVSLPTDHVQATIRRNLQLAGLVAAFVLIAGWVTSIILARRVTEPIAHLTAASVAIEAERFELDSLSEVITRPDELGQLARVFQRMAQEVYAREQRLKQQVQALRIEVDEARKEQEVAEITETEYFQNLQQKAKELRGRSKKPGT